MAPIPGYKASVPGTDWIPGYIGSMAPIPGDKATVPGTDWISVLDGLYPVRWLKPSPVINYIAKAHAEKRL